MILPPINLGQIAISHESPAGRDSKGLPEYELMSNEIAKISSLQGESTVHWENVEHAATTILREHAKDIPTATYLAMALSKNHGCTGWHTGTSILLDILNTWWDTAFPPPQRMRARVNSIDWWHSRSVLFFSTCQEPITAKLSKELQDIISAMDEAIKARLPDASPLFNVREAVRRIPIIEAQATELENTDAPDTLEQQTTNGANLTGNAQNIAKKTPLTPPATMAIPKDITSGQSLLCTAAQHYVALCFDANTPPKHISDPLTWKAFYMSIWGKIQSLPPAENSQTRLPAPDADRIAALFTMLDAEKHEGLMRACAFFAPEVPFCLDIQYVLCEAFSQAGAQYAPALSVAKQEIEIFLTKFKGVESLTFSDGQAFAGNATKAFFKDIQDHTKDMGSDKKEQTDIVALLRADCAENISKQDFLGAMSKIHTKANTVRGADLLKIQLEEIRLLLRKKHTAAALAIAHDVEASLDFHHLERWDAALSQEALQVLRNVWEAQKKSEDVTTKTAQIAARLYRLNPTLAFT